MSEENVEIVRSIYEAANRRDWDAAFRDIHPEAEITAEEPGVIGGPWRGRGEVQGFWEGMIATFEAASSEPEQLLESGDQVAAVVRTRVRPKGTSAEIELRNGHLWTFRDGKAVSLRLFRKPEEALEAAGLRE